MIIVPASQRNSKGVNIGYGVFALLDYRIIDGIFIEP